MALTKKFFKNGSKNKKNSTRIKTKKNSMKGGTQKYQSPSPQKPTISQQKPTNSSGKPLQTVWERQFLPKNQSIKPNDKNPFTRRQPHVEKRQIGQPASIKQPQYLNIAPNKPPEYFNVSSKPLISGKSGYFNVSSTSQKSLKPAEPEYLIAGPRGPKSLITANSEYFNVSKPAEPEYLTILPQQKPVFNNTYSKDYFLSTGKILNTGNRSARIKINEIQKKLENSNLSQQKQIISNTLSGKYEPDFVKYAIENPDKFKEILTKAKTQSTLGGIYEDPNKFLIKKKLRIPVKNTTKNNISNALKQSLIKRGIILINQNNN